MLEAVWPKTYVNPELIKKYILTIRRVLGDSHDTATFIETIPKRGYQFVAPVTTDTDVAQPRDDQDKASIVGREGALARLDGCLARAMLGQRQIVFVTR
jgi:DNA-binding winged helix-turn-helix (wHTH) protein